MENTSKDFRPVVMKRFDQMNMIPFIDIMLVMLAIVLTTASFISQGKIKVNLPTASSSSPPSTEKSLEISINADQEYFFEGERVTLESLKTELGLLEKTSAIVLRVDKSVRFEKFVAVIDLLKIIDLKNLSIMTKQAHDAT